MRIKALGQPGVQRQAQQNLGREDNQNAGCRHHRQYWERDSDAIGVMT